MNEEKLNCIFYALNTSFTASAASFNKMTDFTSKPELSMSSLAMSAFVP